MLVKDNENVVAMFDVALDPDYAFATPEINHAVEELLTIRRQISLLNDSKESLMAKIKEFISNKESLVGSDGTVIATCKEYQGQETIDMKALKSKFPQAYEECLKKHESFKKLLLK